MYRTCISLWDSTTNISVAMLIYWRVAPFQRCRACQQNEENSDNKGWIMRAWFFRDINQFFLLSYNWLQLTVHPVNHCILTIEKTLISYHRTGPPDVDFDKAADFQQAALSPDDVLLRPTLRASEPLLRALEARFGNLWTILIVEDVNIEMPQWMVWICLNFEWHFCCMVFSCMLLIVFLGITGRHVNVEFCSLWQVSLCEDEECENRDSKPFKRLLWVEEETDVKNSSSTVETLVKNVNILDYNS